MDAMDNFENEISSSSTNTKFDKMSSIVCKNCKALESIIAKKVHWFNLLSAENVSFHHSLITARKDIRHLQNKISNLQKSSFNDHQEIIKLYIEIEYFKCQFNKNMKESHINDKRISSLMDCQKKIQMEQLILLEKEKDIRKQQDELYIHKLQEHINIILKELEICNKELIYQTKYYLNERQVFRELFNEEKLKYEVVINNTVKDNMHVAHTGMQTKFDKILKYKDEQMRRQEHLITVLRKQQDAVYNQFHKMTQNTDKVSLAYKNENNKLKEELKRLHEKFMKLENRRILEMEGYKTQIKLLTSKIKK